MPHPHPHVRPPAAFLPYFKSEAGKLNDPTLNQEVDTMNLLISA